MAFITGFTQLTDKWFYKLIQLGEFPKPIKLGRSSRWLQSEVEAWVLQRITDSRIHGFTDSRIHGFTDSRIHGFTQQLNILFYLQIVPYFTFF